MRRPRSEERPSGLNRRKNGGVSSRRVKNGKDRFRKIFFFLGFLLILVELVLLRVSMFFTDGGNVSIGAPSSSAMDKSLSNPHVSNRKAPPSRSADGSFGGFPVYYQNVSAISYTKPYTLQHCVGENYQSQSSWMQRSCHFKFMCFNMTSREFQVYRRPDDISLLQWSSHILFQDLSATHLVNSTAHSVSLGGINKKWGVEGIRRLRWYPTVSSEPPIAFYSLPDSVVMIPFHSLAGWNPGHAVWDDFLPIFTLMQIFQLDTDRFDIFAMRYQLPGEDPLWASCDSPAKKKECVAIQNKFWPLLNNISKPVTQVSAEFTTSSKHETESGRQSDLVCSKNGLAGIGPLTDHGTKKLHGWHAEDYERTHNHGRGAMLWKFRVFCLKNLGYGEELSVPKTPYQIVISMQSSSNSIRNLDFSLQKSELSRRFQNERVSIRTVVLKDLSLKEQIELASKTSIFITGCGGGAVTATFLPKEATLIVYYNELGGQIDNQPTNLPARLDWDLFNHMSYLRVHWLPSGTMENRKDMELLFHIVSEDLRRRTIA